MSGYAPCTCRDCFEIATPTDTNDGLCLACQGSGCEANAGACKGSHSYGGEGEVAE